MVLAREPECEHVGTLLIDNVQAPLSMAPEIPFQGAYAIRRQPYGLTADGIAVSQLSTVGVDKVFAVSGIVA